MARLAVKHGILGILAGRPCHGYELKTAFDGLTGGLWELNIGQIYSTLERMLKEGLVCLEESDEPGEDRKAYGVTPAGLQELDDWLQRPPLKPRPMRDELLVRLGILAERSPDVAMVQLAEQRRMYHGQMAELTRRKIGLSRLDRRNRLLQELALDAALLHAEADLKWLETCEAKLRAMVDGPNC
ncbi:MAG TPA: PadR family transcriptional regulator [Symbiobacteriaceae bacterium]|nr:PadR family transcriptional regulator [Symbiobacteriaceae bacterium]